MSNVTLWLTFGLVQLAQGGLEGDFPPGSGRLKVVALAVAGCRNPSVTQRLLGGVRRDQLLVVYHSLSACFAF